MKGFLQSLVADRTNWIFVGGMVVLLLFGLHAKIQGDESSWIYCAYGVGALVTLVVLISAISYYKKQKND